MSCFFKFSVSVRTVVNGKDVSCVRRYEFFVLIVGGFIRPLILLFFVTDFYSGTHNPAGRLLSCYTKINGQIAVGGVRDDNGIVSNGYS